MTRPDEWVVERWYRALDIMRGWNVPVAEVPGWQDRGRPWAFNPKVLRNHWTATGGYEYDYASLGIVRDGRSDLPGPLSQGGLGRHTGTFYMIAAGYSNDGGEGEWEGHTGNGSGIGIEHENDGVGEEFQPVHRRNSVLANAAICIAFEIDPARLVCEHFEWSPFKIDRNSFGDPTDFRAQVAAVVANGGPIDEEDELSQADKDTIRWLHDMMKKVTAGLADDDYQAAERLNATVREAKDHLSKPHTGGGVSLEDVRRDLKSRL